MPLSCRILGPVAQPLLASWPRWAVVTSGPGLFGAVKGQLPEGRSRPGLWGGLIKVWQTPEASLVGPLMGGSQALMVLEFLKAAGVADFLFLGTAGALKPENKPDNLTVGDVFMPTGFIGPEPAELAPYPSLENLAAPHHTEFLLPFLPTARPGRAWSRLTPFQATGALIKKRRLQGALAVDLECAYLAAGATFLGLNWAPILLISDELGPKQWLPGWRNPDFRRVLPTVAAAAVSYLKNNRPA